MSSQAKQVAEIRHNAWPLGLTGEDGRRCQQEDKAAKRESKSKELGRVWGFLSGL
jgi:hypothetical protein